MKEDRGSFEIRIGQGLDVHPFAAGRRLILGGVEIPHSHGLAGHSDADALVHALIDALLGAAGQSDIGTHFPDSDPRWKDISSLKLLELVWQGLQKEGWRVVNMDLTVLAQVPKLAPYIGKMKDKICAPLGLSPLNCAIKATTTERLGFVGREEGLLASAVVLLERERTAHAQ